MRFRFLIPVFLFFVMPVQGQENNSVQTLDSLRCRLVLPSGEYYWVNPADFPGSAAGLADSTGTRLMLLAMDVPADFQLDEASINSFERGLLKPGVTKIEGRMHTFRELPSYDIHVSLPPDGSIFSMRVFVANGLMYQLCVQGSTLPVNERNALEPLYSAFEFTSAPVLPRPKTSPPGSRNATSSSSGGNPMMIPYYAGKVTGFLLLIALGIMVYKRLFRPKKAS